MPSPGEASPEGRAASVWNGDRTSPRGHKQAQLWGGGGSQSLSTALLWLMLEKSVSHYQSKFRRLWEKLWKKIHQVLLLSAETLRVSVLRKHLHQKQTWVWACDPCEEHSELPSGCCLSNDFILQVDVWGGLPNERSTLGRPCAQCSHTHGSCVCQPLIFIAESSAATTRAILIAFYNLWKCSMRALLQRNVSSLSLVTRCCQARGDSGKVRRTKHSWTCATWDNLCIISHGANQEPSAKKHLAGKPQLTLPGEPWDFCREE